MLHLHSPLSYDLSFSTSQLRKVYRTFGDLSVIANLIITKIQHMYHVIGFLNTNVDPDRNPQMANYGLMDQIAALKWVQENVKAFGGDPESITVFGHNTGAASIHFLMQSPIVLPGNLKTRLRKRLLYRDNTIANKIIVQGLHL